MQLPRPDQMLRKYPHELSGGQRQRLMIAMALLPGPDLVIADEPTTALDVTIQAQILGLIRRLATERNVAVLLTTHDLGAAYEICDAVNVMYAGQDVESAPVDRFFAAPAHPYTTKLLASLPDADGTASGIPGEVPGLITPPGGCRFHPRCERADRAVPRSAPARRPARRRALGALLPSAPRSPMTQAILSLGDLQVHFAVRGPFNRRIGSIKAVDGVSFDLMPGEVFGLVGESGCGKSTLGKAIMGIHKPTAGEIWFEGQRIDRLAPAARRAVRRSLQYAYQDPGASLDPRWKIGSSLHEPLVIHTDLDAAAREKRIRSILEAVGLPDTHLDLYPHEISGGQQRRVGLARILTLHPKVVILDEPTSGLDVSVQATVLSLFRGLRETFDLTYVLISHDLAVIRTMCSRVAVMYLGRIVESGPTEAIFDRPRHPYTRSLVAAIPKIGGVRVTRDFWLQGEPPDPGNLPSGCRFRTRCPKAADLCAREEPALSPLAPGSVACHFPD